MLNKLLNIHGPENILELKNLERMLEASLPEIRPRSGYEGNLRRRLSDYSRPATVVYSRRRSQDSPTSNDVLLMMVSILSGAAVLVMGIRVAILTIAGVGLLRNMKRTTQTRRWQSPRPAG